MTPERRAALFILFFISICIPFGLLFIWHDPLYSLDPWPAKHKYAFWAYFAGVVIYVQRLPERWSLSGKFDYLGASHQIFHCCVLVGIAFTFLANQELYEERLAFKCPA